MIDPKRLTEKDVDRWVIYIDGMGTRTDGVIKSWNDRMIFVRYATALQGQATFPVDLDFGSGTYQDGGAE